MKEKVKNFIGGGKINYNLEHDSPVDFVTSQWQLKEKSAAYLIYRWMLAKFYLFSFFFSFSTSYARGELKVHFIYLTNWIMFASAIFTFLAAVLVTMHFMNKLKLEKMTIPLKLYWYLSICCTMYACLITFTYWTILFHKDAANTIDMNNVIIHMTNCLIVLDIFIVKHKCGIAHFVWPLITGLVFLGFTYIYTTLGGVNRKNQPYIYPILDWNSDVFKSVLSSFAILALGATIHCILVFMHHIRGHVHKKVYAKYQNVPVKSEDVESQNKEDLMLTC